MVYFKFIGNNNGNYPYRLGLNTLKYNNETFKDNLMCEKGGLYFSDAENILNFLDYGDTLCVVSLPENALIVKVHNKYKANKIIIEEKKDIKDIETWKFLIKHGVNIYVNNNYVFR